uniref:C-X-C motif chemokine 10 n=1 Tax=Desmodus rotundus TaxID=9430 RepID=K9IW65_DESRO|nr:C-X-C motif chemokine 10-like [Desmodus rotundus]
MNQSALLIFCLTLLTPSGAPGIPLPRTTRCTCVIVSDKSVNPNSLEKLEMISLSQSCPRVKIIATMKKNKEKRCLNPESKIIKNILKALSKKIFKRS